MSTERKLPEPVMAYLDPRNWQAYSAKPGVEIAPGSEPLFTESQLHQLIDERERRIAELEAEVLRLRIKHEPTPEQLRQRNIEAMRKSECF